MLSFIYRLMRDFEVEHGMKPNVLYMNKEHFQWLRHEFVNPEDVRSIIERLDMYLVIDHSVVHPHLTRLHYNSYSRAASF